MRHSEYYEADVLRYFQDRPREAALYQLLFQRLSDALPDASVKVQKSQISFYGRHLFAAVSLPVRRKEDWPEHCLVITFGLAFRLDSPRVSVAVEPYPNRWTHHVLVTRPEELDAELLGWLRDAYDFGQSK